MSEERDTPFHYSKRECADAHLDAACKAFLSGEHPTVVVTLAGVAEEIYGALITSKAGWTKTAHPRAIDVLVDWAIGPDGLGMDRDDAWKYLYGARNAVKHARDPRELAVVDPAAVLYMITTALINRLSVDRELSAPAVEVAQKLTELWQRRPDWVRVQADNWERRGS